MTQTSAPSWRRSRGGGCWAGVGGGGGPAGGGGAASGAARGGGCGAAGASSGETGLRGRTTDRDPDRHEGRRGLARSDGRCRASVLAARQRDTFIDAERVVSEAMNLREQLEARLAQVEEERG